MLTTAQAYALGYSREQLRTLVRRRCWSVPRRGVLAVIHPAGDTKVQAALAATAAALVRAGSIVSHESAAILHGLPVLDLPPVPTLTIRSGRSGTIDDVHLYRAPMAAGQIERWYGVPIASVARTAADVARRDRDSGLIVVDSALNEGLTSVAELRAAVEVSTRWPGNSAAGWVLLHADGRAESPLESLARSRLIIAGLPTPNLQVWIAGTRARVDMLYEAERLVIEADGMLKYRSPADLRDEKRRQERIERAGYRVIRVMWSDVRDERGEMVQLVARALRLAA